MSDVRWCLLRKKISVFCFFYVSAIRSFLAMVAAGMFMTVPVMAAESRLQGGNVAIFRRFKDGFIAESPWDRQQICPTEIPETAKITRTYQKMLKNCLSSEAKYYMLSMNMPSSARDSQRLRKFSVGCVWFLVPHFVTCYIEYEWIWWICIISIYIYYIYLLAPPPRSTFSILLFAQSSTRKLFAQLKRKTKKTKKKKKKTRNNQNKQKKKLREMSQPEFPLFFFVFFGFLFFRFVRFTVASGIFLKKTLSITGLWYSLFP